MEQTAEEKEKKQKKKIPTWCKWLIGYGVTVVLAVSLVYFWRVIFFTEPQLPVMPITLYVLLVFSFLYGIVFLLCRFIKQNICLRAAICVFVLGLLFVFAVPPMQAPDEHSHYLRAYSISQGHFTYDATRQYPNDVAVLARSFPAQMNFAMQYQNGSMAEEEFSRYWENLNNPEQTSALYEDQALVFVLVPMLPQALGMAIGRIFGLGALGLLYAGRIGNLLMYAILCYFIFKNCDKYRGVFFAITMLPLSLAMAASCSYDAMMLAMCYWAISFFCKNEIKTKDVYCFGTAVLLATYIKPLNIVLVAVLLLIPKARWKTKQRPWLAFGAILLASVVFWAVMSSLVDGKILQVNYGVLGRGSGGGAAPKDQLIFVITNIPRFIAVAILTFVEEAGFLFKTGIFGTLDMVIPLVSGLSVLSLAAASALGIQQKDDTKIGGAIGLFLVAILYTAAIMAGLYVLGTDLHAIRITELQPRYFLPVFLLLFMLASVLLGKVVRPRLSAGTDSVIRVQYITLCIVAAVAFIAVILVFQNYFIGQWIPRLVDGTFKLVNLYGWMKQ